MRPTRHGLLVVLLALAGIALAAAITWSSSQLVRQHIGLASEPLTAGRRLLAPAPGRRTKATGTSTTHTQPPSSPPPTSTSTPAPAAQPTQTPVNPASTSPAQPGPEVEVPLAGAVRSDGTERNGRGDD